MAYDFTPDMNEISGFGGDYEAACRRMLKAGLEWLDAHPAADPQFHSYRNIVGVMAEDNDDAKALSEAMVAGAGEFGVSGAMHQATVSAALWIKANGWDAYVAKMTHPEGEVGILRDKLAEKTKDYERLSQRHEKLMAENHRRAAIIAERKLGWVKHPTHEGGSSQWAYAASAEDALDFPLGRTLTAYVDKAIQGMTLACGDDVFGAPPKHLAN